MTFDNRRLRGAGLSTDVPIFRDAIKEMTTALKNEQKHQIHKIAILCKYLSETVELIKKGLRKEATVNQPPQKRSQSVFQRGSRTCCST